MAHGHAAMRGGAAALRTRKARNHTQYPAPGSTHIHPVLEVRVHAPVEAQARDPRDVAAHPGAAGRVSAPPGRGQAGVGARLPPNPDTCSVRPLLACRQGGASHVAARVGLEPVGVDPDAACRGRPGADGWTCGSKGLPRRRQPPHDTAQGVWQPRPRYNRGAHCRLSRGGQIVHAQRQGRGAPFGSAKVSGRVALYQVPGLRETASRVVGCCPAGWKGDHDGRGWLGKQPSRAEAGAQERAICRNRLLLGRVICPGS